MSIISFKLLQLIFRLFRQSRLMFYTASTLDIRRIQCNGPKNRGSKHDQEIKYSNPNYMVGAYYEKMFKHYLCDSFSVYKP